MNPDKNTQLFLNSRRYGHIRETQKFALEHGRCKEQFEGKCTYPHCTCLSTGEEYQKEMMTDHEC